MEYQVIYQDESNPAYSFEKGLLKSKDSLIPLFRCLNKEDDHGQTVILLHGLGSYKESWFAPRNEFEGKSTQLKDALISAGYSLLAPDAPYHGERSYELQFRPASMLPPELSQSISDAEKMAQMYRKSVEEVRFMMDLVLDQQSEPAKDVHLVGYSLGGAVALLVNAADARLRSVTACVPPINRPAAEVEQFDWPADVVGRIQEITPFGYAKAQAAPVAVLFGEEDVFCTPEEAEDFYRRLPMEDKLLKRYPSGHELPASYIEDVKDWLKSHSG